MHRGGAAHVQCRLCARITERLPKILKIFTRNTESTVDGLRALQKTIYCSRFKVHGRRILGARVREV